MDVPDIFKFFLLGKGEGEGESEAPGPVGGPIFFVENARRRGSPGGGGGRSPRGQGGCLRQIGEFARGREG